MVSRCYLRVTEDTQECRKSLYAASSVSVLKKLKAGTSKIHRHSLLPFKELFNCVKKKERGGEKKKPWQYSFMFIFIITLSFEIQFCICNNKWISMNHLYSECFSSIVLSESAHLFIRRILGTTGLLEKKIYCKSGAALFLKMQQELLL